MSVLLTAAEIELMNPFFSLLFVDRKSRMVNEKKPRHLGSMSMFKRPSAITLSH